MFFILNIGSGDGFISNRILFKEFHDDSRKRLVIRHSKENKKFLAVCLYDERFPCLRGKLFKLFNKPTVKLIFLVKIGKNEVCFLDWQDRNFRWEGHK